MRAFALSCSLATLGAASPSPPPSPPPTAAGVQKVEVRLAQYDVVVRDKSGRIIRGLRPSDFRVVEDGVPLEVVAVDEWGSEHLSSTPPDPTAGESKKEGATSAAPDEPGKTDADQRRSFVFVFDALGDSTALRMSQAKRAAQGFARQHLRSNDLAAVYQLDLSLRPIAGFSNGSEDTARAIEKIAWRPGSMLQDEIADSVLSYSSTAGNAYMQQRLTEMSALAASQLEWTREHTYQSLAGLTDVFQSLPGKRILILVSPGFPMSTAGDLRSQTGGFTPKFQNLIRSLSRYGVTVYTLDIGNDLAIADAGTAIDWRVAVGKFGMDENILSDLGLERALGTGAAGKRREFLGFLAAETGGRMLTSSDFSRDFETIQEETTTFYRISCRISVARGASRYRRTTIQTTRPELVVSSRRGRYSDVTPLEAAATTATSTDSLDRYRPIAARGSATPLPSTDPRKIPVSVVVEAVGPIDVPTDAAGAGELDVEFHVIARAADEIVARYERAFTAKVKPGGADALRAALRMEGRLALVPGIYDVQATVRLLAPPQLATWRATVAVPPPPPNAGLAVSQGFLIPEGPSVTPLVSRPDIAPDADPLVLRDGVRVLPPTSTDFPTGTALLAVFWLKNIPVAEGKPKANVTVELIGGNGAPLDVARELILFTPEPTGGHQAIARIDTQALAAGAYELHLGARTEDPAVAPARRSIPFTLYAPDVPRATGSAATSSSAP